MRLDVEPVHMYHNIGYCRHVETGTGMTPAIADIDGIFRALLDPSASIGYRD